MFQHQNRFQLPILILCCAAHHVIVTLSLSDTMCTLANTVQNTTPVFGWNCGGGGGPILSVCSWTGVSCDQNTQQIISIDLDAQANGLVGSASSLNTLIDAPIPTLQSFSIYEGYFNTPLPSSIANLTSLTSLIIQSSYDASGPLVGTIPTELSTLTQLNTLSLAYNNLGGISP